VLGGVSFLPGTSSVVLEKDNLPYIVEGTLTIPSPVIAELEPGTVIKFQSAGRIAVGGNLIVQGNQTNKIIFTSILDDEYGGDTNNDGALTVPAAGYWHFVSFSASSTASQFTHAIVRYGGWNNIFQGGPVARSGAVKLDGVALTIQNVVFEHNRFIALELDNADAVIQNTTFQDNTVNNAAGIRVVNASPSFVDVISERNRYGVYMEEGDCPDVSGITFGTGENVNVTDISPQRCIP